MTSNLLIDSDPRQKKAAAPQLPRAGHRQR
jgi:hypothetical protein